MRYLVLSEPAGTPASPEEAAAMLAAGAEWMEKHLADGTVECTYLFADRGGLAVVEAESNDAVMGMLIGYPLYPYYRWRVRPLVEWRSGFRLVGELWQRTSRSAPAGA